MHALTKLKLICRIHCSRQKRFRLDNRARWWACLWISSLRWDSKIQWTNSQPQTLSLWFDRRPLKASISRTHQFKPTLLTKVAIHLGRAATTNLSSLWLPKVFPSLNLGSKCSNLTCTIPSMSRKSRWNPPKNWLELPLWILPHWLLTKTRQKGISLAATSIFLKRKWPLLTLFLPPNFPKDNSKSRSEL